MNAVPGSPPAEINATAPTAPMDLANYDFLDFGASKGSSITFAVKHLGGKQGLGIDIRPAKVQKMIEAGFACIRGDVTDLALPPDSVRFVVMCHFLEHLPNLDAVERALRSAVRVATDFLFIRGPFFDADDYLRRLGLKFYWSDWPGGHNCHLRVAELYGLLVKLELKDFVFCLRDEMRHSSATSLHPLNSPHSQHEYDANIHPPKRDFDLPEPVYREFSCCVPLRQLDDWDDVLQVLKGMRLIDARTFRYKLDGDSR
jgi:hypothetical protein